MTLIERIDIALSQAHKSRSDLAQHLGISVQAVSNLKRRPGSTMRPEKVAHAARFLHCDLYWLCTGEGGKYVGASSTVDAKQCALYKCDSYFAYEIVQLMGALSEEHQALAFAQLYRLTHQHPPEKTPPAR